MMTVTLSLNQILTQYINEKRGSLSPGRYVKKIFSEALGIETFAENQKCLRCQHTWTSRVETPAYCPACKNPGWKTPRREMRYPQLRALLVSQTCILPWEWIGDPKPSRAVWYESRKFGKKFYTRGVRDGLEVTRKPDNTASALAEVE